MHGRVNEKNKKAKAKPCMYETGDGKRIQRENGISPKGAALTFERKSKGRVGRKEGVKFDGQWRAWRKLEHYEKGKTDLGGNGGG